MNHRRQRFLVLGLSGLLWAAACAPAPRYTTGGKSPPKMASRRQPVTPRSKIIPPANLRPGKVLLGIASFYGPDFHGKLTANGEVYDMYGLTAAHKTLPLNTIIRVTNMANRRNLIVRVNDRGPYIAGRILDLSYGAALKLGFVNQGTTRVKIEIIEIGDNEYMQHLPAKE